MIALFGGSFDPIHLGHLHLAKALLAKYDFKKIFLCPAKKNPLKDQTQATGAERLAMVQLAIEDANESRLEALDWEVTRETESFTKLTLDRLVKEKSDETVLILGNEVFAAFAKWYQPKEILDQCHLIIVRRETESKCDVNHILQTINITPTKTEKNRTWIGDHWIDQVEVPILPFSSTKVRADLDRISKHSATPPEGLQRVVWEYIKENGLYSVK